ncbi:MAG TPA: hypothetical protein VLG69_01880 [Candidatus Andersenbacteria bacterium]|nr:hypothetical protein [Candidatus Andersenbacteria bacterium]
MGLGWYVAVFVLLVVSGYLIVTLGKKGNQEEFTESFRKFAHLNAGIKIQNGYFERMDLDDVLRQFMEKTRENPYQDDKDCTKLIALRLRLGMTVP